MTYEMYRTNQGKNVFFSVWRNLISVQDEQDIPTDKQKRGALRNSWAVQKYMKEVPLPSYQIYFCRFYENLTYRTYRRASIEALETALLYKKYIKDVPHGCGHDSPVRRARVRERCEATGYLPQRMSSPALKGEQAGCLLKYLLA